MSSSGGDFVPSAMGAGWIAEKPRFQRALQLAAAAIGERIFALPLAHPRQTRYNPASRLDPAMTAATEPKEAPRPLLLTFRASEPEREQLKAAASARGMTMTALIRHALAAQGVDLSPSYGEGASA